MTQPQDTQEVINLDSKIHKFFIMLPFIAMDELDPFEQKLFGFYVRKGYENPKGFRAGRRQIASDNQMGANTVLPARNRLAEKGYVTVTEAEKPDEPDYVTVNMETVWNRNFVKYSSDAGKEDVFFSLLELLADDEAAEKVVSEILARISASLARKSSRVGTD